MVTAGDRETLRTPELHYGQCVSRDTDLLPGHCEHLHCLSALLGVPGDGGGDETLQPASTCLPQGQASLEDCVLIDGLRLLAGLGLVAGHDGLGHVDELSLVLDMDLLIILVLYHYTV